MKTKIFFIVIFSLFILNSCTDSRKSKVFGLGKEYRIELINCDGSITHSWISTGKVQSESSSDGYYFTDKTTKKLIEVSGTVIITELE